MVDSCLDESISSKMSRMIVSRLLMMEKVTIIMITILYLNMQPEAKPKKSAREDLMITGLKQLLLAS